MKDTAMYVDVCILKNNIKAGISWNANEKKQEEYEYLLFFRNLNTK